MNDEAPDPSNPGHSAQPERSTYTPTARRPPTSLTDDDAEEYLREEEASST